MNTRRYFICSLGAPNGNYDLANVERCFTSRRFVLHEQNKYKGKIQEIKADDLLILKYKNHFICYGKATSSVTIDSNLPNDWNHSISVNFWIVGQSVPKRGIKKAQIGGTAYDTVKEVSRSFALEKVEEIGISF